MANRTKSASEIMKEAQKLLREAERTAERERGQLRKKWEREAEALGKTLEEVLGINRGGRKKAPSAVKARHPGVAKYLHPTTKKPVDGRVARGDAAFASYKTGKKLDDRKLAAAGLINPEFLKSPKGKVFAKQHKLKAD